METVLEMGNTTISCKRCNSVSVYTNDDLKALREHRCPACGMRMTDFELSKLKMHYYLMLTQMYKKHFAFVEQFNYDIHIWPHYEMKESAENGSREGGASYGKTG